MDPPPVLLSPQSHLAETCMERERSPPTAELSRDSSVLSGQLPSSSLTDADWFGDEHIQAKRARVETIVRGMCLSPGPLVSGSARARESSCYPEKARERKRKQSLPMHQGPLKSGPAWDRGPKKGGARVKEQLHLLKQQLRHLQEHVLQATEPGAPAQGPGSTQQRSPLRAKPRNSFLSSPWTMESNPHQSSNKDICGAVEPRTAEVQQQSEEPMLHPSGPRALVETLRKELNRAVSQAVDSVLQQVLLDPRSHLIQQEGSCQGQASEGGCQLSPPGRSAYKDLLALATLPRRVQPQAGVLLGKSSLATPLDSPKCPVSPRAVPKSYQSPLANCPLTAEPSHIWENQILSQLLGRGPDGRWSGSPPQVSSSQSQPSPESARQPWVLSQQQLPPSFTPVHLESRPLLPSVKMEQGVLQGMADMIPFSSIHIQEGLSPGHLKKAKLMFFFTRYPSSSLLKAYFPDVQFNRCITSQMIKWFSNFREFYYIQMEKYARQAISDGVTNPKMLTVLRDSEIFRVLNTHYNKGNDFEVPDCFLEIATLTLQEFFRAVSAGKDSDPSWKKPIYKIISKLDSDIPEILKSSNYPQELFRS
ncbi:prospero homeobox protein 2 isoform X1 [Peromyscus californicus insignis]|uniref:prospero homeobox protein 2 isoform X1 n=1 Tax=Peromyscus californicus insignis TaxID=564181 RepID=UPI0022A7D75B|nr:prospero homeobox protein 2 isoform X1 [Peromyscus californicus insignis]